MFRIIPLLLLCCLFGILQIDGKLTRYQNCLRFKTAVVGLHTHIGNIFYGAYPIEGYGVFIMKEGGYTYFRRYACPEWIPCERGVNIKVYDSETRVACEVCKGECVYAGYRVPKEGSVKSVDGENKCVCGSRNKMKCEQNDILAEERIKLFCQ